MIVALIGALIGAVIGAAIPFVVDWLFGVLAAFRSRPRFFPATLRSASLYGLLTALVFSIAPLGRAHDLPVSALFRDLVEDAGGWPRKRYLAASARRGGAGRARRPDQTATVDRGDRRRRDRRAFSRCGLSPSASLISRAVRRIRASSNGGWRSPPSIGPAR